jgi:hypothetical protein
MTKMWFPTIKIGIWEKRSRSRLNCKNWFSRWFLHLIWWEEKIRKTQSGDNLRRCQKNRPLGHFCLLTRSNNYSNCKKIILEGPKIVGFGPVQSIKFEEFGPALIHCANSVPSCAVAINHKFQALLWSSIYFIYLCACTRPAILVLS